MHNKSREIRQGHGLTECCVTPRSYDGGYNQSFGFKLSKRTYLHLIRWFADFKQRTWQGMYAHLHHAMQVRNEP